ncbi:MAG: hypothetical protein U5K69_03560 [Balneolaceae bacterium]|nr:hypothetical protein [Balneolaceae bacterium]
MSINFDKERFWHRHIGPDDEQIKEMLKTVGADSLDQLMDETVPAGIHLAESLELEEPMSEYRFLEEFREIASKNEIFKSFLGMGYYETLTSNVIQRNVLENPGWYTSYTPYQAEISQGRLEALINFQTMVSDLTGLELANASLLDEGTAAAEGMSMLHSARRGAKRKKANSFSSELRHPQTIDILKGRAEPQNIELVIGDHKELDLTDAELFGILLQYPATDGEVYDYSNIIEAAKDQDVKTVVAADLLSLTLLTPPGEMGADVVVGSTQRFGIPMGYGGPHAAYFATREEYQRKVPGRIIGVTQDAEGNPAYRMALQTREQHIRREKATSNICTAQVLLAVMAGFYGVYHGPEGLRRIAERIHGLTKIAHQALEKIGFEIANEYYFDTLKVNTNRVQQQSIRIQALKQEVNFRYFDDGSIGLSFDEVKDLQDVAQVLDIFTKATGKEADIDLHQMADETDVDYPASLLRESSYMKHPVFNLYHSEHELLRYLKELENRDLSLVHSMISLGSCTMKLNATAEMIPLSWPEFARCRSLCTYRPGRGLSQTV